MVSTDWCQYQQMNCAHFSQKTGKQVSKDWCQYQHGNFVQKIEIDRQVRVADRCQRR